MVFPVKPLACHDYTCIARSNVSDLCIPIRPLSERGISYFERQKRQALEAGFHQHQPLDNQSGFTSDQHNGVHVALHQGDITVTTTMGNCTAVGSTDILSIINFIPAAFTVICRCIDINGRYYKQDKAEYLEDMLYEVDKARYTLYTKTDFYGFLQDAYQADIQYLKTKLYELEIKIAACGTKKNAYRDALIEVRNRLLPSLKFVESQGKPTPEQPLQQAVERSCAKELAQDQHIQYTFTQHISALEQEMNNTEFCTEYVPLMVPCLEKRAAALHSITTETAHYVTKTYSLNQDVAVLLEGNNASLDTFLRCYGNQYQQCLHQESLMVLEQTSQIPFNSILYKHRSTLVTFTDVASTYNHAGECHKAIPLLDFCWTLLTWGTQIVEGAAEGTIAGVVGAVTDIIEHPLETGISVILGSSVMLTYQLSKIVYIVADLSVTSLINPVAGKQKWDAYVEPINQLLDAIDKKQLDLKELSKAVTQLGVQWYTQVKLLGGLRTFYDGVKIKAVEFLQQNPTFIPQQYLTTPDGQLLKATTGAIAEPIHNNCPATCINQYEKLKEALKIEQFTSIIKTTRHGIQRLIERGFTPEEVKVLYHTPDITKIQKDGAQVFIKLIKQNRYNVMIYNQFDQMVVTAIKNVDLRNLINLGKQYGWAL